MRVAYGWISSGLPWSGFGASKTDMGPLQATWDHAGRGGTSIAPAGPPLDRLQILTLGILKRDDRWTEQRKGRRGRGRRKAWGCDEEDTRVDGAECILSILQLDSLVFSLLLLPSLARALLRVGEARLREGKARRLHCADQQQTIACLSRVRAYEYVLSSSIISSHHP
jgi:hypothetical protein